MKLTLNAERDSPCCRAAPSDGHYSDSSEDPPLRGKVDKVLVLFSTMGQGPHGREVKTCLGDASFSLMCLCLSLAWCEMFNVYDLM